MTGGLRLGQGVLAIDLAALVENWRRLRQRVQPAECAGVVKADGYGLGAEPVARALAAAGCRTFFVAHPGEGLRLRQSLPSATIMVLHGVPEEAAPAMADAGLVPVLNSLPEIDLWAGLARQRGGLPAVLQVDTGMSRLGLGAAAVTALGEQPERLAGLDLKLVMSHLACADEPGHPMNEAQLAAFVELRRRLPPLPASLANSAGILLGPAYHFDLVRPGIALYGSNPLAQGPNPMTEVVRLQGKILQVHDIDRPRTVGYGATHLLRRPARIATVGVGYADGYPRALGNRGSAVVGGVTVPVVGRVSMDLVTLDVSAVPPDAVRPGLEATLIGGGVSLDSAAAAAGTIGYELLTRLSDRLTRVYLGGA